MHKPRVDEISTTVEINYSWFTFDLVQILR